MTVFVVLIYVTNKPMKLVKLQILLLAIFLSFNSIAYASCDRGNLSMLREFSLKSLFSSDEDEESANSSLNINVPVRTTAGDGCYSIKSHLSLNVKIDEDSSKYEIEILPMLTDVENIADFHYKSLIRFVDKDKIDEVKISVLSFACSGRDVLTVESYQGKIRDLYKDRLKNKSSQISTSTFIATGAAAAAIKKRNAESLVQDLKSEFLPEQDLSLVQTEQYLVKVKTPNFIVSDTTLGRHTLLDHSAFSYQNKVINICDPNVYEVFKKYSVEEFLNQKSQVGNLKIRAKDQKIIIQKNK